MTGFDLTDDNMQWADDESQVDEGLQEQYFDMDGNGIVDTVAIDSDGDGILDTLGLDLNEDAQLDAVGFDSDGDGKIDMIAIDAADFGYENEPVNLSGNLGFAEDEVQHGYDIDDNGVVSYMEFETDSSHVGREAFFDENQGILYPPVFDTSSGTEDITGDPASDMEYWHMQTHEDTCAVVSQEFVLEDILGRDFDENELMNLAMENGWYMPGGGTPMEYVGEILEYYGLDVERGSGSIESLESALENGEKVIVGIDANEVWTNGDDATGDHFLEDILGIPDADPNHAVEVIGIDRSDPDNPMVILNDPGHPGGQGAMIPLDLFADAWADSDNYMVTAK